MYDASSFVLLSQDCFDYLMTLMASIKFEIICSSPFQNAMGILDKD